MSANAGEFFNFNASGALQIPDSGYLQGLIVSQSSAGVLTLTDGKGRVVINAMPLTAGQSIILYGARYTNGLTATLTGTATLTLVLA